MRVTRLLLLLLVGCKDNVVVLDDSGGIDPNDSCPVVGVDPFSLSWSGTTGTQAVAITNDCDGETALRIQVSINGAAAFHPSETSLEIAPGQSVDLNVTFDTTDAAVYEADLVLATNDAASPTVTIPLVGSLDTDIDDDGHDAIAAGGDDCNDQDASINPDADEIWYDGVDQNCDGANDNDQDGDGHDATVANGDDCDDTNADVYPGADEVWYDGVDQNCDGANDYDQDGDGHDSDAYGGDDCDDTDPNINGGNTEVRDAADNDCDGLADEDWIEPGDIIVSEMMVDAAAVEDAHGEYFEVVNLSAYAINLTGWDISSPDGGSFTVSGDVVLQPGAQAVFAPDGDSATNGGHSVDYVYNRGDFPFDNSSGGVTLTMGVSTIFAVAYGTSWGVSSGAALNLDADNVNATAATNAAYWCDATSAIGGGDLGTPGAGNDLCSSVDHDGDGVSIDGGDCDDTNPDVNPSASEVWDGLDNDCDGTTDVISVSDVSAGYVTGNTSGSGGADYLGFLYSLSVGDVDGDGVTDLIVGGNDAGNNDAGRVLVLPLADYTTFAGQATSYDTATYDGAVNNGRYSSTYQGYGYFGQIGPAMGDVDGDGVVDLTIGGNDDYAGSYYYPYDDNVAFAVFNGGSIASATADEGDIRYYGAATDVANDAPYYFPMITSDTDLNGDGYADIVYSDPDESSSGHGLVYAFSGADLVDGGDLGDDNDVLLEGDGTDDHLGVWAGSLDYNGDGYADIIAGAPGDDESRTDAGAYYFYNGDSTLSEDAYADNVYSLKITGASREEYLGFRGGVAMGDLDDDGAADLVVASPMDEIVYVFLNASSLSGSVSVSTASLTIENAAAGPEFFGHAMAIGDFNGDGQSDLAIGAPDAIYEDRGDADTTGRVYFYSGAQMVSGAALYETDAGGTLVGGSTYEGFGSALLTVNLNNDGRDDLMIDSHLYGSSNTAYGKIWFIDWN